MKRQVVLLRVGIDAGSGGSQGPLFDDGTFEFVCIPDNQRVSAYTYGNSFGRHGHCFTEFFPPSRRQRMAAQHIHVDPEFETFTYGDPTRPKRSLRRLNPGDFLVFYCGLQKWDSKHGWNKDHTPALYLAGYLHVALAGMATSFTENELRSEFAKNFHVRYPEVYEKQKEDLVLVKGTSSSRLFHKAHQLSSVGKDRTGKPLKVLSLQMQDLFGRFGGRIAIQRSPPRWVDDDFTEQAIDYLTKLE